MLQSLQTQFNIHLFPFNAKFLSLYKKKQLNSLASLSINFVFKNDTAKILSLLKSTNLQTNKRESKVCEMWRRRRVCYVRKSFQLL